MNTPENEWRLEISFKKCLLVIVPLYAADLLIWSFDHRAQRSQIWGKLRLNSQEKCGADQVCWFQYKTVIEQSFMGSYYRSVERLSPSRQWSPMRKRLSESEAFRTRHGGPTEKTRDENWLPRHSFNVDQSIMVTETEVKFCYMLCMLKPSLIMTNSSSKQRLIKDDKIHTRATRQRDLLHLPAVRTEVAKRSFYYHGCVVFNNFSR